MIKLFTQRSLFLMTVVLLLSSMISGCNSNEGSVADDVYNTIAKETKATLAKETTSETGATMVYDNTVHPMVQIEMEDGGIMVFELYPEYAPETVENFVSLAESGFYDGLTFHRIIKGFMVQGGDPLGTGSGGSDETITGEFASNGFEQNTLKHTRGVISMARSSNPNSASSQFFIMDGTVESLDGDYAAFGMMIEGDETLTKIAETKVEPNARGNEISTPTEDVVIKTITVVD